MKIKSESKYIVMVDISMTEEQFELLKEVLQEVDNWDLTPDQITVKEKLLGH